jgi:hypothetical protein
MDILSYKKAKQAKSLAETGLSQSPNGGIDMFSQTWPIIGTFGAGNNGGTVDQTNKKITIPAGSSGKSSWLGWQFPVGKNFETLMNSKTIYLKFLVKHSIGFFTASNRVAALIQNSSGTNVLSSVTITAISDTLSEVSAAFSMPSTRYSWIEPCFQVGSTEVFSADAWVQIMSLKLYNNVYNLSNLNIILDDDAHVVKTVKPSGGDYASPKLDGCHY